MWSKVLLITEVLILILIAVIIWYFDYNGIQIIIIICIVGVSIFITGLIAIKNRKIKSRQRPDTNIEDSRESMIGSNPNVPIDVNRRNRHYNSTLSDESVVLQQSYFSPQIVSAVIENRDKTRESVISNNEVPPTYEEAKHLPKFSPKLFGDIFKFIKPENKSQHEMGNNVTTTPVETLKIDETNDDIEDNDNNIRYNTNAINGSTFDGYNIQSQNPNHYPQQYNNDEEFNDQWTHYQKQYLGYGKEQAPVESHLSINERIEKMDSIPDFNDDETTDVLSEMKELKPINELSAANRTITPNNPILDKSLPLLRRSIEDNEIYDLESIESGSKLTLNDVKSDTEDVIQELNKLNLDLDDNTDKYSVNYRRRGQSWSNWDNNVHGDLKAESSLSSFSRPASINDNQSPVINGIKTKSYTAPETRGREDSAIEWLAKQHGLEIGNSSDNEIKQKPNDSIKNRNTLRSNTFEIPGSIISLSSTSAVIENELHSKYDELDQKIINSIENDYMR